LLFSLPSVHAEDVEFDCQSITGPLGQVTVDTCKPSNVSLPLKPLSDLASSVYDLFDGGGNLTSNCTLDPINPSAANCTLGSGASVDQAPFNLNCLITPGSTANGYMASANCQLVNSGFETVLTMDCSKDPLKPNGACLFKLNKEPILDQMSATGRLDNLTTNENAINGAFWTCLNRVGNTPLIQAQCDKLLLDLMDPELQYSVREKLIDLFERITPKNTDVSLDISLAAVNNSIQNIRTRLNQLRNGFVGNSVNVQFFDGQQWLDKGAILAQNSISMNDASPEKATKNISEYGRLGVFLNGTFIKSQQAANTIEQSHNADTQTMTLGMDYRITDQWIAGTAVNISQSTAKYGQHSGDLDSGLRGRLTLEGLQVSTVTWPRGPVMLWQSNSTSSA
jgi:hypothetical protein